MVSPIVLSYDDMVLAVTLQGGAIEAFARADQALFCTPALAEVRAPNWASFPMLPFCSRIKHGRFKQAGQQRQLAPNFAPEPHTIHGFGWQSLWQVESSDGHACALVHEHDEALSGVTGWPWLYRGRQHFMLTQGALRLTLSVENCSDEAMPVGLGLHPHLPLTPETSVAFQCRGRVHMDNDFLPRDNELDHGRLVDPMTHKPWHMGLLDTVFTHRSGNATVVWPGRDWALRIEPDAALPHWIVYAPMPEGFICIEPVSHLPNAINLDNAANLSSGMRLLAPGAVWQTTTVFKTVATAA